MKRTAALASITAVALLAWGFPTCAGSFRVGPTRIVLDEHQPVAVVRVTNNNDVTTAMETRIVRWRQEDNGDLHEPATQVLATPPVFELKPGQSQVIRVGLLESVQPGAEAAFRLYIGEIPPQNAPADAQLSMILRVGVPLFVRSRASSPARLEWTLVPLPTGELALRALNAGGSHARLLGIQLGADGERMGDAMPAAYVLPGATRQWLLPRQQISPGLASLDLRITTPDGVQHARVSPISAGLAASLTDAGLR